MDLGLTTGRPGAKGRRQKVTRIVTKERNRYVPPSALVARGCGPRTQDGSRCGPPKGPDEIARWGGETYRGIPYRIYEQTIAMHSESNPYGTPFKHCYGPRRYD